jgi:ligand-binding sensor domain-containing protein/signal transduction histidine kinase
LSVRLQRRIARRHETLLVALLLATLFPTSVPAERLPIRIYSTADGLAHNTVNRIVRDSQGFLWFCTLEGLSRFDGYGFRNFGTAHGLPPAGVNHLLETRDGDYWVATDSGLVHLDRRHAAGSAETRLPEAPGSPSLPLLVPPATERLATTITTLLQTRDSTVWVGTGSGLFQLERASGTPSLRVVDIGLPDAFPEQRTVADLLEDRHGTLWVGTPAALYRRWPDGRVAAYTTADGLPAIYVSDLFEDRDGRLWVSTRDGGLFRLVTDASSTAPVVDLVVVEGLPYQWVTQMFQTSDGRFWVATGKGLAELMWDGAAARPQVRVYTPRQGMSPGHLSALAEDLGGNLWIASTVAGAMKLVTSGFTTYGDSDGIDSANDVFEDRAGNVCFRGLILSDGRRTAFDGATLDLVAGEQPVAVDGYGCFDGQRFQLVRPDAMTVWGWVREGVTLQAANGEWWIGSQEGVFRYASASRFPEIAAARPLAVYKTEDGLAAIQIYRLFEDRRGDVWISSISSPTRGLSRFERLTGRIHDLARLPGLPSLVDDTVRAMAEDPAGSIWLAFNAGLIRYANGEVSRFTPSEGLPAGAILNMHVDRDGRLWLASSRVGLVRVDHPLASVPTFVSYTTADGLSSNSLAAIAEDRNGYLYVGGGNGIDRFDPATGHVRHFTAADGLGPGVLRAAFTDTRGVIWFALTNGLARLAPAPRRPPAAPPILISGLRVAGAPYRVSPFGERAMTLADLPPDRRQLEIDFVGLGFAPGEVLRYQYRLAGADADWSVPTPRRTITYASLSPGRYTFSVRAVNADGLESAVPATLSFTILRPFWQRWWFLAAVAALIASTAAAAYRYRVRRLLEVANMRTHIATDLHDDIGANLTRIALLSEVARRTHGDAPLESIATIARESVSSMSDIVWAINPRRESLLDLTRRMRQHADELFTLRGIDLRFDASAAGDSIRLGVDIRRDLLLIFKEAVNNVARHSGCTAVQISLQVEHGQLVLRIEDDGRGFDPAGTTDGQGLTSMRARALRISGVLSISPRAPHGTRLVLRVPL